MNKNNETNYNSSKIFNLSDIEHSTIGMSSNINEVIRAILNSLFFIYFFFLQEDFIHAKAQKAYKRIKTKKTAFLCA